MANIKRRTMARDAKKPPKENLALNYEPLSEKHSKFHEAYKIPTRVLSGGVGTGKSRAISADIIGQLLTLPEYKNKKALVAGITGSHLRNLLVPEFKKVLSWQDDKGRNRGLIEGKHYKVTMHPMPVIELFQTNTKIEFVSLEAKENLRGFNASLVYADDIGEESESTYDALCDRAFREEDGVGGIMVSLNPTNMYHWAYRRFFQNELDKEKFYVETLTMYDNPALKGLWAIREAQYAHDPVAFRRKIMGEWCSNEGLVYPNYKPEVHIMKRDDMAPIIQDCACYLGLDFGAKDPTAAVWIAKKDDRFYIYREYYSEKSSTPISVHAKEINRHPEHVVRRWSDHYTESVNTYRENGIELTLAQKGNGAKRAGIELINQLFSDNRLFISEDCVNLKRELESYEYPTTSRDDLPKDGNDHALDATRYCLFEIAQGNRPVVAYNSDNAPLSAESVKLDIIQRKQNFIRSSTERHVAFAASNGAQFVGYERDGRTPIFIKHR